MNSKSPERVRGRKVARLLRSVARHDILFGRSGREGYADAPHTVLPRRTPDPTSYSSRFSCLAIEGLRTDRHPNRHPVRVAALHFYEDLFRFGEKTFACYVEGRPELSLFDPEHWYTARIMALELAALVAEEEGVS